MERIKIIAEIGECFNGDLERANKMILVAKEAGCDFAKFQTLDYEAISENEPEGKWFKKIALNPEKIEYLVKCSIKIDMPILFSPENVKTAHWLLDAGLSDVKIASMLITDLSLFDFCNQNFRRIFMSTGRASLNQVKEAVRRIDKVKELYIMHCISEYPCGALFEKRGLATLAHEDVRLNMMRILTDLFPQYKIGYSDHTSGILAPVAAVAMGAKVIEKHITLDRKTPIENFKEGKDYLGTDHLLSLEPHELKEMVTQIREVEKMFGEMKWERSKGEKIMMGID